MINSVDRYESVMNLLHLVDSLKIKESQATQDDVVENFGGDFGVCDDCRVIGHDNCECYDDEDEADWDCDDDDDEDED